MATASGTEIFSRARTIATQVGGDANLNPTIDSLAGIRALLNHSIREVYRRYANDDKFLHDTVTRNTVAVVAGIGACPDTIIRESLPRMAQFQDADGSLITYYNYNVDYASDVNFNQLGYVTLVGDNFNYAAPNAASYTGNLFVTTPTFPTLPADMASSITFPSETAIDDIVLFLSQAILGKTEFQVVS